MALITYWERTSRTESVWAMVKFNPHEGESPWVSRIPASDGDPGSDEQCSQLNIVEWSHLSHALLTLYHWGRTFCLRKVKLKYPGLTCG